MNRGWGHSVYVRLVDLGGGKQNKIMCQYMQSVHEIYTILL